MTGFCLVVHLLCLVSTAVIWRLDWAGSCTWLVTGTHCDSSSVVLLADCLSSPPWGLSMWCGLLTAWRPDSKRKHCKHLKPEIADLLRLCLRSDTTSLSPPSVEEVAKSLGPSVILHGVFSSYPHTHVSIHLPAYLPIYVYPQVRRCM